MAQLEPLARRVQERLGGPAPYKKIMERHRPVVKPLREQLVGKIATPLWILLGTVAIVFLIACVNVANLFTVRAENRRNDLAVRRALGAGRGDLVRSQMTEALLLAAAGGAAGALHRLGRRSAAGARGAGRRGGRLSGAPIPGLATATLDGVALLFTAGLSVLAACLFGLLPALRLSGAGVGTSAAVRTRRRRRRQSDARCAGGRANRGGARAAGWIGAPDAEFLAAQPGRYRYDTKDIFTFQIAAGGPDPNNRASHLALSVRLHGPPEGPARRESVGFITTLPLDEGAGTINITTPKILASGAEAPPVRNAGAGGAYFQTMGISVAERPLLRAHGGRARNAERDHQRDRRPSVVPR